MKKQVQYLSDLHLEMLTRKARVKRVNRNTKYLVLAGDIGYPEKKTYQDFLKDCCSRFKYVILISGNHEYYQFCSSQNPKNITEVEDMIRSIVDKFDNLYYLQNESITLDGLTFYGCTFWSHIPTKVKADVGLMINDFRRIYIDSETRETLNIDLFNELHQIHLESLIDFLENYKEEHPAIIITHHCPLWIPYQKQIPGIAIQTDDTLNYAFCSEQSKLIEKYKSKIHSWIFGHTHRKHNLEVAGVRVCSNPKGYPGELYHVKEKYECPAEVFEVNLPDTDDTDLVEKLKNRVWL